MKSITIHKLDSDLAEQLEKRAKRDGSSLNRTVKSILRNALGLSKPALIDHRNDFLDLFGSTPKEEAEEVQKRIDEARTIDPSDWKA